MPDVKYCGGTLELKKIVSLSEAAADVCVTMPNFHILEFSFGEVEWRAEMVNPPEELSRGFPTPSTRPGLGINLNDRLIARMKAE